MLNTILGIIAVPVLGCDDQHVTIDLESAPQGRLKFNVRLKPSGHTGYIVTTPKSEIVSVALI